MKKCVLILSLLVLPVFESNAMWTSLKNGFMRAFQPSVALSAEQSHSRATNGVGAFFGACGLLFSAKKDVERSGKIARPEKSSNWYKEQYERSDKKVQELNQKLQQASNKNEIWPKPFWSETDDLQARAEHLKRTREYWRGKVMKTDNCSKQQEVKRANWKKLFGSFNCAYAAVICGLGALVK